jgi:hypothetical protein
MPVDPTGLVAIPSPSSRSRLHPKQ